MEGEQVKTAPPREVSYNNSNWRYKKASAFRHRALISADQINIEYLSLQDLLQGMDESERKEVQPLVDGMILAWHERREKDVISKFNHTTSIMATRSTRHVFEQWKNKLFQVIGKEKMTTWRKSSFKIIYENIMCYRLIAIYR